MKKFLPDLIAILAFIILSFAYFFPNKEGIGFPFPQLTVHQSSK